MRTLTGPLRRLDAVAFAPDGTELAGFGNYDPKSMGLDLPADRGVLVWQAVSACWVTALLTAAVPHRSDFASSWASGIASVRLADISLLWLLELLKTCHPTFAQFISVSAW